MFNISKFYDIFKKSCIKKDIKSIYIIIFKYFYRIYYIIILCFLLSNNKNYLYNLVVINDKFIDIF